MKTKFSLLLLLPFFFLGIVSCSDDDDNTENPVILQEVPDLQLDTDSLGIPFNTSRSIEITEGGGVYKAFALNENVAEVTVSDNIINVKAVGGGETSIIISDKESQLKQAKVIVYYEKITTESDNLDLLIKRGSSARQTVKILQGNGGYTAKSGDESVVKATITNNNTVSLQTKKAGTTEVVITDKLGKTGTIKIKIEETVKPYTESELQTILASDRLRFYFDGFTKYNSSASSSLVFYNDVVNSKNHYGWKETSWWSNDYIDIYMTGDKSVGIKENSEIRWKQTYSSCETTEPTAYLEIIRNDGDKIWVVFSHLSSSSLSYGYFVQKINP